MLYTGSQQASAPASASIHSWRVRARKRAQFLVGRLAGKRRCELLSQEMLPSHRTAEGGPELELQRCERHVSAVAGFVDVVADQAAGQVTAAPLHRLVPQVLGHRYRHAGQRRPQERPIYPLSVRLSTHGEALARPLPRQQRQQNADRCPQRTCQVGHGHTGMAGGSPRGPVRYNRPARPM